MDRKSLFAELGVIVEAHPGLQSQFHIVAPRLRVLQNGELKPYVICENFLRVNSNGTITETEEQHVEDRIRASIQSGTLFEIYSDEDGIPCPNAVIPLSSRDFGF